ncbi:MAG: response regulator transcription factor [Oscillospiraceae bacterium]|nr:response regulator transcription factor [Oscillospiraceae bacterium]MBR6658086.1 response regulator transcription factor [Oscillospiraceae bacterium]
MYNLLICDDERDIRNALKIYLSGEGYKIFEAENGEEALEIASSEEIHLVLMDIMMPKMDGVSATLKLRENCNAPVIFLTAKSEDTDKIFGLSAGADDYITKPFNPLEVIARVKAQLRRYAYFGGMEKKEDLITVGGLELDDKGKTVSLNGEILTLTPTEYEIMKLFIQNPGKVFSSKEIYSAVWSSDPLGAEGTIAVHIRHIREKIEIDPANPRYLKVVWGKGYKLEGKT